MKILLVEDDATTRKGIRVFLDREGHKVVEAENGKLALQSLRQERPDLIISDVMMPEMNGLELLRALGEEGIRVPVIMVTAYASVQDAVQAVKNGAEDYLTKPLNLEELKIRIGKIESKMELLAENRRLIERLKSLEFPEMVGVSKAMREVQELINRVAADPDVSVMITGESGTGKELAARAIHNRSARAEKPFVAVNCAAFPENLLESELFGYKRGAFTGAYRDKVGYFQAARQGTLFLDEVGDMSPNMQAKLLRVLQEGTMQPLGGTHTVAVDVRIIGASNKNLAQLVEDGLFREDLYYRLNVVEITVPPLRERQEDIPLLIEYFLAGFARDGGRQLIFSSGTMDLLLGYSWPGNVRELENLLRRLLVTCKAGEVRSADLPEKIRRSSLPTGASENSPLQIGNYKTALEQAVQKFEKDFLSHHLLLHGGNITRTAAAIGLSRVALHKKIKQLGIDVKNGH